MLVPDLSKLGSTSRLADGVRQGPEQSANKCQRQQRWLPAALAELLAEAGGGEYVPLLPTTTSLNQVNN